MTESCINHISQPKEHVINGSRYGKEMNTFSPRVPWQQCVFCMTLIGGLLRHLASRNIPANTAHSTNVGSMWGQCRRRWPHIEPTLVQCAMFAICPQSVYMTRQDLAPEKTTYSRPAQAQWRANAYRRWNRIVALLEGQLVFATYSDLRGFHLHPRQKWLWSWLFGFIHLFHQQ